MTLDRAVMMFAGFMVLVSLALGYYVSPYWLLLTAFVGLNLLQASVTGFCPAAMLFVRCEKGISHSPLENMTELDAGIAIRVLLETLLELARREG